MTLEPRILGDSPPAVELRRAIHALAPSDLRILIRGETGTGKELVARSIHECGRQAHAPFVAVNCAELTPGLAPSTLFGHLRGSYTDARADRHGVFELAKGGTLFFDEIGDLPFEVQGMLLRILETGVFTPLGGERSVQTIFRFISATHRNLEVMAEEGTFRRDLLHRIAEALIAVPPLRERSEDVPLLARHFLIEAAQSNHVEPATLPDEAVDDLRRFPWHGNVRELKNCMRRLAIRNAGRAISVGDFDAETRVAPEPHLEENRILQAVRQSGSIAGAAKMLGIHRTTLWRKMSALGLSQPTSPRRSSR